MKTTNQTPPSREAIAPLVGQAVIRFVFLAVLMVVVLFWSAGKWNWWEGWAYMAVSLLTMIVGRFYLIFTAPDQIVERMEAPQREHVKPWDRFFVLLIAFLGPVAAWVVAGLDVRYGWSPDLPLAIQWIALALILAGTTFSNWAMIVNRFYSSHVRIQKDRGHAVVSSGPYRLLRHPGYAGDLVAWIAVPFFFSSTWVAIPCVLVILAYFVRTALEDRTLQAELPGYREYAGKVRYRLIPGLW
ncbi:MAG: isoprenylcysteine carboxylmethyltransferase family protein [Anaerolineales bacterium]|jgi:protein-S-isoprenylcysteine O-methyltransferase Ste14